MRGEKRQLATAGEGGREREGGGGEREKEREGEILTGGIGDHVPRADLTVTFAQICIRSGRGNSY